MVTRRKLLLSTLAQRVSGARLLRYFSPIVLAEGIPEVKPPPVRPLRRTPSDAASDFASRASGAGVVRAFDFTDLGPSTLGLARTNMPNYGYDPAAYAGGPPDTSTNKVDPVIDNSTGLPAIKFTVPTRSGSAGMGRWFINFSEDLQTRFDGDDPENNEFYLQIRCRFDDAFMTTLVYTGYTPGSSQCLGPQGMTAMKIIDIDMQDYPPSTRNDTNTQIELVIGTFEMRRMLVAYQGSAHHEGLYSNGGPPAYDPLVQNAVAGAGCTYNACHTPGNGINAGGRTGGPGTVDVPSQCVGFFGNEWMTFQVHVKLGPSYRRTSDGARMWKDTRYRLWSARENQASILLHDQLRDFYAGNPGTASGAFYDCKYGKLWMGPYMTCKDPYAEHPEMHMWCAEFIVSKQPIPDPGVGTLPIGWDSLLPTAAGATAIDKEPPEATSLTGLAKGRIRDLGYFSDGALTRARMEYGSLVADSKRSRILLLAGGGHTMGVTNDAGAFNGKAPLDALYPSDSAAQQAQGYIADTIIHSATNHLAAIHTFLAGCVVGDEYYLMTDGGSGASAKFGMSKCNLLSMQWSAIPLVRPWYYVSSVAVDPISGKILVVAYTLALSAPRLWVFDPQTNLLSETTLMVLPFDDTTYPPKLIYHPALDKFIAILPSFTRASTGRFYPGKVFELTFDRKDYSSSAWQPVQTTGDVPPGIAAGGNAPSNLTFDPVTGVICGPVIKGMAYSYDAVTKVWASQQLLLENGAPSTATLDSYYLALDPVSGCIVFIGDGYHVFAYRA